MSVTAEIEALEAALERAKARFSAAIKAMAPKHKGGEPEEFDAAWQAVLEAERALSLAKHEPHAVPLPFPVQWDTGAPTPLLLKSDHKTFLVFYMRDVDPNWDGTYTNVRRTDAAAVGHLAVCEFERCLAAKMGSPNDEAFHGHPLYGKGLQGYRPMRVENSLWIHEIEKINSAHHNYRPAMWQGYTHYIFGFHDSTFECIAKSVTVEVRESSLPDLLREISAKLAE